MNPILSVLLLNFQGSAIPEQSDCVYFNNAEWLNLLIEVPVSASGCHGKYQLPGMRLQQLLETSKGQWILLWDGHNPGPLGLLQDADRLNLNHGCWGQRASPNEAGELGWLLAPRQALVAVGGFHPLLRSLSLLVSDCLGRLEAAGYNLIDLPFQAETADQPVALSKLHSRADHFASLLALAHRSADLAADAALIVSHPWGLGQSQELNPSVTRKWRRVWRLHFWSQLMGVPEPTLRRVPEAWFPGPDADGVVAVSGWQRLLWRLSRRGPTELEKLFLRSCRFLGGR